MLKKIVLSFAAVIFLLGSGASFAADLNEIYIMNGETTKSDVLKLFGEPDNISTDIAGREKVMYEREGSFLEVTFDKDVAWDHLGDSAN